MVLVTLPCLSVRRPWAGVGGVGCLPQVGDIPCSCDLLDQHQPRTQAKHGGLGRLGGYLVLWRLQIKLVFLLSDHSTSHTIYEIHILQCSQS